ncbi:MAG: PTS sugar transporter [Geobacteraceae bacterium]|nr:PTS sugar transporter [Geobacteraceae bacterium]
MTGLVIVAHAGLAAELINAAEMIVGKIEASAYVEIKPDDSVDKIRTTLTSAIESVGCENIIIMTDMFGGTPSNMSLSFLKENRIEVLTGVNLPMIIRFASDRNKFGVSELAAQIRDTGREGVTVAGDYLKK